ncbi:hypothetical protein D3C73_1195170 [compost metagenome]
MAIVAIQGVAGTFRGQCCNCSHCVTPGVGNDAVHEFYRDSIGSAQRCLDFRSLSRTVRELQVPAGVRPTRAASQCDSPGSKGQVTRVKVDGFQAVGCGFTHAPYPVDRFQVRQRRGRFGVEFLLNFHIAGRCHDCQNSLCR